MGINKSMKFLTQLNSGCIDICKNMLKSAEKVGLNVDDFLIACLDKNAYEHMKEYKGAFLHGDYENQLTDYQDWSFDPSSKFRQIVRSKWKLIQTIHDINKNLCWVDTDIVFKQNPMNYIISDRVLFQCDIPGSVICSGFMIFNSTKQCDNLVKECGENTQEDDQILINTIATKYTDSVALLNQELFPNGYVYYTLNKKEKAVIVHNNHMVGIQTKINKFKDENLWLI